MKLTTCRIDISPSLGVSCPGWLIQFPYNAEFLEEFKEAIDAEYREWRPAIKSWWVREECESMLAELFENWAIAPVILKHPSKVIIGCSKCNDTGLNPFEKNGKVIPHASVYCECHQDKLDHYHRVRQDDFDFACSSSFRGYSYNQCGLPDPGYNPPAPDEPKEQVIVHRHSNMGAEERDMLQQTSLKADYLEKKLTELSKKQKPKKTGYKGLR